jgi:hypothetical protein
VEHIGGVCNRDCHCQTSSLLGQNKGTRDFPLIDSGLHGGQGDLRPRRIECDERERESTNDGRGRNDRGIHVV